MVFTVHLYRSPRPKGTGTKSNTGVEDAWYLKIPKIKKKYLLPSHIILFHGSSLATPDLHRERKQQWPSKDREYLKNGPK